MIFVVLTVSNTIYLIFGTVILTNYQSHLSTTSNKVMKNFKIFVVLIALLTLNFSNSLQAQSKRQLKAEIAKLKNEKNLLAKQLKDKEAEAKSLNLEVSKLEKKNLRLENDLKNAKIDYNALNDEFRDYKTQQEAKAAELTKAKTKTPSEQECQYDKLNLQPNHSYTLDFKKLNLHGWGLQVYSFSDLCSAKKKADEFSQKYSLYKTYIRIKEISGSKVYAVIYGSLKYRDQAEVYRNNFKNIAEDPSAKNAFLVQH